MPLRLVLSALAGALLAAAFEPVGWTVLAPGALAALALCVHGIRGIRAASVGLAFGIAFFFTLQWWMRAVGTDAWIGLSLLEALFFAPLALIWAHLQRRTRWWPALSAVAWVAVETVRSSWPFSGMPWGRLSYAVADSWWAPGLPWYGFAGVSFLVAWTGLLFAWCFIQRPGVRPIIVRGALVALATVAPLALPSPVHFEGSVRVAVVQGDVPGAGNDLVAVHREVTANHVRATRELAANVRAGAEERPDFVLWPENSTATDPFRDAETRLGIETAVDDVDVPVLVGAMVDADAERVLNQGVVWSPETGAGERYTKWHPVPFGEYIPWRDLIFTNNLGRLQQIGRDMQSGTRTQPLRIGEVRVADAICFDVAYDDGIGVQVREGAELLVVQTSNAMFSGTAQLEQQFEITRLRALASGRSLAVASTNGVSALVAADGSVIERAPVRTTSTLVESLPLSTSITPAIALGLWPGRLAVTMTIAALLWPHRRPLMPYIRRRPVPASTHEDPS